MKKTVYYQLNFRLESPLAIGSGEGESTDKDIIVDKYGQCQFSETNMNSSAAPLNLSNGAPPTI